MINSYRIYHLLMIVAIAMITFTSCSNDDDAPVAPDEDTAAIDFGIVSEGFDSRALIIGTDALNPLCTPTSGEKIDSDADKSERVGILADLIYKNTTNRKQNLFLDHWMYKAADGWKYYKEGYPNDIVRKHWVRGTYLVCSAYYPTKFMTKHTGIKLEATNANKMQLTYSAISCQEDLLIGYNVIDSDNRTDKDANKLADRTFVPILMQHGLAALKFQFKSPNANSDDAITKVWLDDTDSDADGGDDWFAVVGNLIYETVEGVNADGKKIFTKNVNWTRSTSGRYQNYIWENTEGLPVQFNPETIAVPYTKGNNTNADADVFCNNDGFILLIPQKIPQKLFLCFTTKGGGPKKIIKQQLYNQGGLKTWEYNNRYIYTIKLSPAGVQLTVDVQPWNEIKSNTSVEIG